MIPIIAVSILFPHFIFSLSYNQTVCTDAYGVGNYVVPCWINYTLTGLTNGSITDPNTVVQQNIPLYGWLLFILCYIIPLLLFYSNGGKEKFLGVAFIGLFASYIFRSYNLVPPLAPAFAIGVMVTTVVLYFLIKD